MLTRLKALREKRNQCAAAGRDLVTKASGENRDFTAEENVEFDRIHDDAEKAGKEIERIERQLALDSQLDGSAGRCAGGQDTTEEGDGDDGDDPSPEQRNAATEAKLYRSGFRKWLRGMNEEITPDERKVMARRRVEGRALGIGSGSIGGFTVPDEDMQQLEVNLLAFGGMREVATTITTATGADQPWPTSDDTANEGVIIAQNTQVAEQDVAFGQLTFKSFLYSTKMIRVPVTLEQDSAFDLTAFLQERLAERIARITNRHYTVGVDTTEPQGIVVASSQGKVGLAGQTLSVIYDDLVDLIHSVDPAYRNRPGAGFMFADSTLKAIRKLKDTTGLPLWQPSLQLGTPNQILGFPYTVNQHMAAMAANAKSIIFGALKKYYIRRVRGLVLMRLTERFADFYQTGYLGFIREDGRLVDAGTDPVKHYANSAT